MYIKNIADEDIVKELNTRLDKIDIDAVLESSYIEEFIQGAHFSPFPTIFNTERPDVVTAEILEGRIAILVDGTPFVLIVPSFFSQHLHVAEDYYNRSDFGLLSQKHPWLPNFFVTIYCSDCSPIRIRNNFTSLRNFYIES